MSRDVIRWVPATLLLIMTSCTAQQEPVPRVSEHRSELVEPAARTIRSTIESFGSLVIRGKADITAAVDGRVHAMPAREGEFVESGQVVAVLENIQLQIRLRQAESDVARARSGVLLQEARVSEAQEGIERRLLGIEQSEIEQEMVEFEQSFLAESIANAQELEEVGGTSSEELRSLHAERIRLEGEHATLSKQIELQALGLSDATILEAGESVPHTRRDRVDVLARLNTRTEQAELDVARSALESARAEQESAALLLEELMLRAPRDGIVARLHVQDGERVNIGDPVISMFANDLIHALLPVRESEADLLAPGLPAEITVPSLDGERFFGEVERISPTVDPHSGSVASRVLLENNDGALSPGMFVRGQIEIGEPREALAVPPTAVVERGDSGGTVMVVRNRLAMRRPVEFGVELEDGWVEIVSGLSGEELLVDSPSPLIREGDRIVE